MGARLPPVPPSLLQEGYRQRSSRPDEAIISPRPRVPPAESNRTTRSLEYQASVAAKQHQLQAGQSGDPGMANARIANWVASTPAGQAPPNRAAAPYLGPAGGSPKQQPGMMPMPMHMQQPLPSPSSNRQEGHPMSNYAVQPVPDARGTPPSSRRAQASNAAPPPQVHINSAYEQRQQTPPRHPPSPGHPSMHPPRASSMVGPSAHSSDGGNYPAYDPQFDRRGLHHSYSEVNLNASGGRSRNGHGPSIYNPTFSASTSRLNPGDTRHRTTSMVSGPPPSLGAVQSQPLHASTSRPLSSSSNGHTRPMSDPDASLAQSMSLASISTSSNSALCIALPSQAELSQQREAAHYASNPSAARVSWAKSVLKFVERHQASSAGGEFSKITDPTLVRWTDESIRLILSYADNISNPVAEALYLRGELSSSGKFPSYRSKDLSSAFRDFETAANFGYHAAWAKIALAYETYGEQNQSQADFDRAKRAYEEGVQRNEVTCTYRMAMAHLLGQLGCRPNPSIALPLLHTAGSLSTVDDPLPAYIYGMLLAGELDLGGSVTSSITPDLLLDERGQIQEARPWIERAAYLGYAAAQFKMGFNYEYATMGCGYDPLLSVQYYSLASQQGDIEADMALSKWFLCGSEAFDLQENLAFTFAEKAAKRGLPSAEFALGYYFEIGIGGRNDIELSKSWYTKAAAHGNTDAADRLASLQSSTNNVLSRTEHEAQMNDKIVRRRTQAKLDTDNRRRKDNAALSPPDMPPMPSMPSHLSQSTGPSARPSPRVSPVNPGREQYGRSPQQSMPGPSYMPPHMPQAPIMPTTDSNMSLRRRDTMRQVEQAAQNNRNSQGRLSQQTVGGQPPRRENPALAPPLQDVSQIRRYSLVDDGPKAAPPLSSPSAASSSTHSSGVQMVNKPSSGPQTFEAMGLKTGKVKAEQECVIC